MAWRARVEPTWRETTQFKRIEYRRVETNSHRIMYLPGEWPQELRWIVEEFRQTEDGRSIKQHESPRFFVTQNRRMIATATGFGGFDKVVRPTLRRLVGA